MRILVSALVLLAAATAGRPAGAGTIPPPPNYPKFWTVNRCETVLHTQDWGARNADGHGFHVGSAVCVGTGGREACEWTSGHRSRLYSEFTVFSRSGRVVRSWTLATRPRRGFVAEGLLYYWHGRGAYYMAPASVRLLAPDSTPARFRSIVAPLAARVRHEESATGCARG